jgi:predicted deacylase
MSRTYFAELKPKRGTRVQGVVSVPGVDPAWELPAFVIRGAKDGPTLAVTAGVHAAEYAGIAAAIQAGRTLDPQQLRGTVIIVPLVNTPGFYERSMYTNPRDGKNINRTFPGRSNGSTAERVTHFLTKELFTGADAYLDLHGGDVIESLIPFSLYQLTGKDEVDARSAELAEALDLDYILAVPPDSLHGGSYTAAAALGIPALIAEAGQQGIYDSAAAARHSRGLTNVLIRLGMVDGTEQRYGIPKRLARFAWLYADAQGLFYPSVAVGDLVQDGQNVGEIRDLFGEPLQTLHAEVSGPVLFLVTALAVNKGNPLMGVGTEEPGRSRAG